MFSSLILVLDRIINQRGDISYSWAEILLIYWCPPLHNHHCLLFCLNLHFLFLDFLLLILHAVDLFLNSSSSSNNWLIKLFLISGFRMIFLATRYWIEGWYWTRLYFFDWILVIYSIISGARRLEIDWILFKIFFTILRCLTRAIIVSLFNW